MVPVQLCVAEAEDEIRGATVTGAALRMAWITPGLLPAAARDTPIFDANLLFFAFRRHQRGVGLGIVPSIGVASPLACLFQKNPRLDSLARCPIARLTFQRKCL